MSSLNTQVPSVAGGDGGSGGGVVRISAQRSITVNGVISVAGGVGQGDTPSGRE